MKKYKVEGSSEMMDAEMNCRTIEEASDIFEMMMNSGHYYEGRIIDNFTAELYCYFNQTVENNGIKLECWTAFA